MNLGELLIKLGVSEDEYWAQLQKIKQQTAKVGADIEKSLGNVKLTIDVNDKELTGLNKHLDLKVSHHKKVQAHFDSNPLTVKVDDKALKTLNQRLASLERGITIPVGIDTKSVRVAADSPSGARGTDRIVKAIENQGKKSAGEKVAGAIAAPIKAAGSIVKSTIGTIATGSLEKVGRDLSADLSEGLSSGLRQELSYTLGSLGYIGEEIGKDVIKGIISSLGRDGQAIEQAIAQAIGQPVINREGAAVRGQATADRRKKKSVAKDQASLEAEFVSQNLPEILEKGNEVKIDRERLQRIGEKLKAEFNEFSERLGRAEIDAEIAEVDEAIKKLSEELSATEDPKKSKVLAGRAKQLASRKNRLRERVDSIHDIAIKHFDSKIRSISDIDDQLVNREREVGRFGQAFEAAQSLGAPKIKNEAKVPHLVPTANPTRFNAIARQVASQSGVDLTDIQIPNLVKSGAIKGQTEALYTPQGNKVEVPPELYAAIKSGELTAKQIETVVHELRHAIQLGFGKNKITDGVVEGVDLITPNRQESRKLGRRIERSVGSSSSSSVRALEQDAYVFADRFSQEISAQIARELASNKFINQVGTGGGRLENQVLSARNTAAKYVITQKKAGIGSDPDLDNALDSIDKIYKTFSADIESLVNIDLLPTDEIEAAGVDLNRKMRESIEALKKLARDYGKITAIAQPIEKKLEPVLVERQSPAQAKAEISRTGSRSDASVSRTRLNKQTYSGEVGEVGDMIAQAVTVSQKDIDAAIAESKRLADQFKDVYALFKRFVKEGDLDKVERLRADIETYAVDAQASIDSAIAKAKTLDTPDNSLVNSLGGQKGQIGRKVNLAQQQAIKLRRQQESAKAVEGDGEESLKSVEDIAENVRDYLAKLQQSVGKKLDPDEFSNAESAAYSAAGKFGKNQIKFEKAENQINNRANSAEVALAGSLGKVGSGSETLGDRVNRIFKAENVPEKAQAAIGGLIGQITKYTGALTALGLFTVGFTAFKAIAGQATAAAVEINNAERKLKLALGSLDAAQQKISDIRARANELGTNASQDIAGETRLQIAARGTSLSGNNASSIG